MPEGGCGGILYRANRPRSPRQRRISYGKAVYVRGLKVGKKRACVPLKGLLEPPTPPPPRSPAAVGVAARDACRVLDGKRIERQQQMHRHCGVAN